MTTRKLYSRKGTMLGTVTYPDWWDREINERGGMRFHLASPAELLDEYLREPTRTAPATIRTGTLVQAWHEKGAVNLLGCTLEEFERVRGCSFAPGAAYLRSVTQ